MKNRFQYIAAILVYWVPFPFVLLYGLLTAPFDPLIRHKKTRRLILETSIRWMQWCQIRVPAPHQKQLSKDSYKIWCTKYDIEEDIETLGEGAELLWVGRTNGTRKRDGSSKRTPKRVILYFHGGAFIYCLQPFAINFLTYVIREASKGLSEDGADDSIALAMLAYSLVPDAAFPTQLHQATLALRSLLDKGIDPSNIMVMGDSAGGNLVAQLLGHMLHPIPILPGIPHIPTIEPNVKLGGAYLLSPWVTLIPEKASTLKGTWKRNDGYDILSTAGVAFAGNKILGPLQDRPSVLDALQPYITLFGAPADWWERLDSKVGKVLITAGELEVLCDDIIELGRRFEKNHTGIEVIVVKNGIHNDPTFDFFFEDEFKAGKQVDGKELKRIVDWAREVFK
ncbi:Alpha/Beta hydrolase protein [Panaeolus papilionaceus]|nr:Alpha/Beta hydrolase protein [Panaeolus papilionaceus]